MRDPDERGFEREERAIRELGALESLDRYRTLAECVGPVTIDRIIPQAKKPRTQEESDRWPIE